MADALVGSMELPRLSRGTSICDRIGTSPTATGKRTTRSATSGYLLARLIKERVRKKAFSGEGSMAT